jgi:hypothetical protein
MNLGRCEVEDPCHSNGREALRQLARRTIRDRQDGDLHTSHIDFPLQVLNRQNRHTANPASYLLGIDIERRHHLEPPAGQIFVAQQRRTEATCPEDTYAPLSSESENPDQRVAKFSDRVSTASLPERTELTEVLPDLSRRRSGFVSQFPARNNRASVG